jgi:predicted ATPase
LRATQLEQAADCVLFDRCAADFLAYLLVGGYDIEPRID